MAYGMYNYFFAARNEDSARLRFIKIDVEGNERKIIAGMAGIFGRGYRPIILTEVTVAGDQLDDLLEYSAVLAAIGYGMHLFAPRLVRVTPRELRPGFHGNVLWLPSESS